MGVDDGAVFKRRQSSRMYDTSSVWLYSAHREAHLNISCTVQPNDIFHDHAIDSHLDGSLG